MFLIFLFGAEQQSFAQKDSLSHKEKYLCGLTFQAALVDTKFIPSGGLSFGISWKYVELGYDLTVGSSMPGFSDFRIMTGCGQMAVPLMMKYFMDDPKTIIQLSFVGLIIPRTVALKIPFNKEIDGLLYVSPWSVEYIKNYEGNKGEDFNSFFEVGLKCRRKYKQLHTTGFIGITRSYNMDISGINGGISLQW